MDEVEELELFAGEGEDPLLVALDLVGAMMVNLLEIRNYESIWKGGFAWV